MNNKISFEQLTGAMEKQAETITTTKTKQRF